MKKSYVICIVFVVVVFQLMCCWNLDISSATIANMPSGHLTNGFGNFDPFTVYHLSLYGLIISFIVQTLISVNFILGSREEQRDGVKDE